MDDNNTGKVIGAIFGLLIVTALITLFCWDVNRDLNIIDTRVETVDGKTYDCAEAYAHNNGMTYIRKPYYMEIPTRYIKQIKRIK